MQSSMLFSFQQSQLSSFRQKQCSDWDKLRPHAYLDAQLHGMSDMQHSVAEEEVAQRAVSKGCASLSQHFQLRICQACSMSHHSSLPQQACLVKQSSVSSSIVWMQRIWVLHLGYTAIQTEVFISS